MTDHDMVYYPQDEMLTFLLPVTRGCSYNGCAFCSMYKDIRYEIVSLSEIEVILMNAPPYTEKVFLTGADPLSIGFERMREVLTMIRTFLPYCACVASYASICNLSLYSEEELAILHDEGLRLLYIGFESGDERVLQLMKKPHLRADAIREAKKLNSVRLAFNTIILYGLAGSGRADESAMLSASMINQFTTSKVITMKLEVFGGTELERMVNRREFQLADSVELLHELKTLIEYLEPKRPLLFDTSHPTNLIRIKGILPDDRGRLLAHIAARLKGKP